MIGEKVGNYVIKQLLGEGGMGAVYLAEHPQIGKKVALKVLHEELASNHEVATRFFQEAKAVNSVGHPNIVDILDFGSIQMSRGNMLYLVMELLQGQTVTNVVAKGALEPARAVRIVRQVADALVASHESGIVHRDLKPDNIMLVSRGRDPEFVKLLDFGIAKVTGSGGQSVSKTRTGMVIGTPIYMSPEQCEGRGDIDHRTDVYALGIVLYELLTGRVPFTGDGYAEILVKHLTEQPAPLRAYRPDVPPALDAVVLKMLAKRREDRFANMREVIDALGDPQAYGGRTPSPTGPQVRNSSPTGQQMGGQRPTGPQLPTGQQMPIGPQTGQQMPIGPQTGQQMGQPVRRPASPTGPQEPTLMPQYGQQPTPAPYMSTPSGVSSPFMPTQAVAVGGSSPTPAPYMPTPGPGGIAPHIPTPYGVQQPAGAHPTTLSGSAAQVGTTSGSGKGKLVLGGIAAAAVIGGVIAVVMMKGGDKGTDAAAASSTETTGSASGDPNLPTTTTNTATTNTATTNTATTNTATTDTATNNGSAAVANDAATTNTAAANDTAATTNTATTTTTPTKPAKTKIAVESTPRGASVYLADETSARCKTPCSFEMDRADADASITLKLPGFADAHGTISRKADTKLALELAKKRRTSSTTTTTKPTKPKKGQVGDDTLNPFDN